MNEVLLFPGRFQPFHHGHLAVLRYGLARARRVVVVCGGVDIPRAVQNPWSFAERKAMIEASLSPAERKCVDVLAVYDNPYRPTRYCASLARALAAQGIDDGAVSGVLAGDGERGHLVRSLPQAWPRICAPRDQRISTATVREHLLTLPGSSSLRSVAEWLPTSSRPVVERTLTHAAFNELAAEFAAVAAGREQWRDAPWPPVFVTVDAVVVRRREVLLIERGRRPGKGLWALPGGFLDQGETVREAGVRELLEETAIDVAPTTLAASIRGGEVFDEPRRSARGRTITHAFLFDLDALPVRPRVRGGDDARRAEWFAFASIRREQLFEDHYAILQAIVGVE